MSGAPLSALRRFVDELLPFAVRLATGAVGRWREPLGDLGRQRIFFANHSSHLDAILVWAMLPGDLRRRVRPVAAKDYWEGGAIRPWLARRFRAVLVERNSESVKKHPLEAVFDALDAGDSLIIFPEGTRSPDGEIAAFKSGLHRLAKRAPEADLVPVHLENLNRILPKGEFLPAPALCFAAFGEPTRLLPGESRDAFLERTRGLVLDLAAWQVERRRRGEDAPTPPRAPAPPAPPTPPGEAETVASPDAKAEPPSDVLTESPSDAAVVDDEGEAETALASPAAEAPTEAAP
jgi:1-acyl-sn-glycerol-3-phosphate acyltransferase